jgi:hypothetical protein
VEIKKFFEYYNQYYQKVTLEDMQDLDYEQYVDFTQYEVNEIKKLISNHYNITQTLFSVNIVNNDIKISIPHFLQRINYWDKDTKWKRTFKPGGPVVTSAYTVYKFNDDWFYLVDEKGISNYYKCDQLEGLLKCLKDNLIEIEKY